MAKILGVSVLSALSYKMKFDKYLKEFKSTDYYYSMVKNLSGMYQVLRSYGEASFSNGTSCLYDDLKSKLIDCECQLSDNFIIESTPYFTYNDDFFLNSNFNRLCTQEKLDYIVWMTRRALLEHLHSYDKRINSLRRLPLTNECKNTSYLISDICRALNIPNQVIKIPAAFNDEINLYNGSGYHYFVIARIDNQEFLIDCTYRQFFRADANNLHRMGIVGFCGCDPGIYMMLNKNRKNVALAILKNGWIKCTEENFKHYLDGFTLSFRNGLYYDWIGKVDYSVGYTADDYVEFLTGEDYITNYEPVEGLGEQETPLKNTHLKFR